MAAAETVVGSSTAWTRRTDLRSSGATEPNAALSGTARWYSAEAGILRSAAHTPYRTSPSATPKDSSG